MCTSNIQLCTRPGHRSKGTVARAVHSSTSSCSTNTTDPGIVPVPTSELCETVRELRRPEQFSSTIPENILISNLSNPREYTPTSYAPKLSRYSTQDSRVWLNTTSAQVPKTFFTNLGTMTVQLPTLVAAYSSPSHPAHTNN